MPTEKPLIPALKNHSSPKWGTTPERYFHAGPSTDCNNYVSGPESVNNHGKKKISGPCVRSLRWVSWHGTPPRRGRATPSPPPAPTLFSLPARRSSSSSTHARVPRSSSAPARTKTSVGQRFCKGQGVKLWMRRRKLVRRPLRVVRVRPVLAAEVGPPRAPTQPVHPVTRRRTPTRDPQRGQARPP